MINMTDPLVTKIMQYAEHRGRFKVLRTVEAKPGIVCVLDSWDEWDVYYDPKQWKLKDESIATYGFADNYTKRDDLKVLPMVAIRTFGTLEDLKIMRETETGPDELRARMAAERHLTQA